MNFRKRTLAMYCAMLLPAAAHATNGMNLEGYGPTATAMGGAGAAYDTSNSAVMNNPATLSLMEENTAHLGVAIRMLGPDVNSSVPSMGINSGSDGDAYYMPSLSYIRRDDKFTYGAAVLAQGGMGTEYGSASGPSDLFFGGMSSGNPFTATPGVGTLLSGQDVRSELSVGRLMLPLSVNVNDQLTVGGSLDFSWASMDLRMDMDGAHFANLLQGQGGSATGPMVNGIMGMMGAGMITDVNWARLDFSDGSDYTGESLGYGFAGKIGATYAVNDQLRIGAAYHTQTAMSDMKANNATMSMSVMTPGGAMTMPISGQVKVKDFQWPATLLAGVAYQANEQWLFVGDVKWVDWSGVMDAFRLSFVADGSPTNVALGMAGQSMDMVMDQKWDDQIVVSLGAAYKVNKQFTLRGGVNLADNPIPNNLMNPLFPATIESHYSAGFTYNFDPNNSIGGSLTYAPEVAETNGDGIRVTHSQTNWSLGYTYTFR